MSSERYFSIFFVVVLLASCSSNLPVTEMGAHPGRLRVCKVAVYPFFNETDYPMAGILVYRVFVSEVIRLGGFNVLGEGDLRKVMVQQRLLPGDEPTGGFYRALVDRFDVDAVIIGRVIRAGETKKGPWVEPELAFWIQVVDPKGHRVLWSSYNRKTGGSYRRFMHFGMVENITKLARRMSDEIISQWRSFGFGGCVR